MRFERFLTENMMTSTKTPAKKAAATTKPATKAATTAKAAPEAAVAAVVKKTTAKAAPKTAAKAAAAPAPAAATTAAVAPAKAGKPRSAPRKKAAAEMPADQRRHYVEVAAYYIAERRGFTGGNHLDDWVQAETEVADLIARGILKA